MPGSSSRLNGLKGGRPCGVEGEQAKARRYMKKRWLEGVHSVADKLFMAHLDLALGCLVSDGNQDGLSRVYKRPPDRRALQWLLEQALGKPPQTVAAANDAVATAPHALSRETLANLERSVSYILPKDA